MMSKVIFDMRRSIALRVHNVTGNKIMQLSSTVYAVFNGFITYQLCKSEH